MKRLGLIVTSATIFIAGFSGCVSMKKYLIKESELAASLSREEKLNNELNLANQRIAELESIQVGLTEDIERLKQNMGEELRKKEAELNAKEAKLKELQEVIAALNGKVEKLRNTITAAMESFKSEDISVMVKEGKVYVSMSEKLLFKSGSYKVDPLGIDALGKLATVLNNNPEIEITVEGHTDNVGTDPSNWDLSVMRATSIIRILTDKKVDPKRITASGRGPFLPVASNDTEEGRAKNRRTEIVLSPNLREFFDILNGAK
jgi:chemotaxis protein MotB